MSSSRHAVIAVLINRDVKGCDREPQCAMDDFKLKVNVWRKIGMNRRKILIGFTTTFVPQRKPPKELPFLLGVGFSVGFWSTRYVFIGRLISTIELHPR